MKPYLLLASTALLIGTLAVPASASGQRQSRATGGGSTRAAAPRASAAPPPPTARSAPAPVTTTASAGAARGSGGIQDRAVVRDDPADARVASPGGDANTPGRRRGDQPQTGTAVPRTTPPPTRGGGGAIVPVAVYPWGLGYGLYYGAYDPWYGWYPDDVPPPSPVSGDEGKLRLKVKPAEAAVYADGYYAGIVDDYNGIFQGLRLDAGVHRIEIRLQGYGTLSVDVRIEPDETTTYHGELVKLPD